MQVGADAVAGQGLERGLAPKHPRCPVELRVVASEQTEYGPTDGRRYQAADGFLAGKQPVTPVTGEVLVPGIAGQGNRDSLAGRGTDAVGRDGRAVGIGLVVGPDQGFEQPEVVDLHRAFAVIGVVLAGDLAGIGGFVVVRIVEGDRAGLDAVAHQAGHDCDDRARIHAAGQERTQWHLGNQAALDRVRQVLHELGPSVGFGRPMAAEALAVEVPPLPDGLPAVGFD